MLHDLRNANRRLVLQDLLMDHFLTHIRGLSRLSEDSLQAFAALWKPYSLPKGHFLVREGEISRHFYYLSRGAARIFYYKNDREVTEYLTLDDSFFLSILSFFRQQPSRLIIQLLEPSELLAIHHDDLMHLCDRYHDVERLFRLMLTESLIISQYRVDSLQFETAEQRYKNLITNHPDILQRVPLTYIASYLGVTLETLSRIRAGK
ncbi:MAG: Crp/Fnr family transcriptional regulator [Lewinellaceae bacterium]|nr:Crp/Fnr family transcriptional regulator [Lewinellaceae bacterium]